MLVEIDHLTKTYKNITACEDICLSLEEGQVFGLLGPNGAGKSTLVKMLCGLVKPSAGKAYVKGLPADNVMTRKSTGYMPELFRYYDWMTAYDLLKFYAGVYEIPAREQKNAIYHVLEMVGLINREKEKIKGFSKGMQQRLGLAVAIIHRPCLVFLDEPTSALDPIGRRTVRDIIYQLRDNGTSVFLNSHLLGEVEMTCTHLGFIKNGHLIASGPKADFMQRSQEVLIEAAAINPALLENWEKQGRQFETIDNGLRVHVSSREEIPVIINDIVMAGGQVFKVESRSRGLEEVFLEYIGN